MELLPEGPLYIIASHISKSDAKYRRLCDVSKDAASLMLVGNLAFAGLSLALQEKLEPDGLLVNDAAFERMRITDEGLTETSKVNVLKKACRDRGLRVSGVKAALWRRLKEAEDVSRPPRGCILSAKFRSEMRAMSYARICVSKAKSEYRVTERDLSTLRCELVYKSTTPKLLYSVRDVARVALEKQETSPLTSNDRRENREVLLSSTLAELSIVDSRVFSEFYFAASMARDAYVNSGRGVGVARATATIIGASKRMLTLEHALKERGCNLRTDSRLCCSFIDLDVGNPVDIANSMHEMRFLFDHTEYKLILDNKWRDALRELDSRDEDDDEDDKEDYIDPDKMSESAKSAAIKRWAEIHDPDEVPDMPESLRETVFCLKSECIVAAAKKAWRARQPQIPFRALDYLEKEFEKIQRRTRDAESLAALQSTLEGAETVLFAHV